MYGYDHFDIKEATLKTSVLFIPTFELKIEYDNEGKNSTVYYTENHCGYILDYKKFI